ncbi:hypothetical protein ACFXK0_04285 [Nocardia sp. NPDC059177]|uniref:hypothetical protein n=1 Tax=Nocardia sp. NPDC059177 TaxID=3346759 RepID=UPI003690E95C
MGIPISALLAGIGALAGGSVGILVLIGGISQLYRGSFYRSLTFLDAERKADAEIKADIAELGDRLEFAIGAVLVVLLCIGGVLLLCRRAAGLTMVIIGSGLAFFIWIGVLAVSDNGTIAVMSALLALVALCALVAALLPGTHRWIDAGRVEGISTNRARSGVGPYN